MKKYLIILYFIVCIALMAISEAFNDTGVKIWAHRIELFYILVLISGPFLFKLQGWQNWAVFIISLVFWRIVGFDYIYNLFAGHSWDYHGSLKVWDKVLSKTPEHGIIFGRIIFLAGAIFIPLQNLRTKS